MARKKNEFAQVDYEPHTIHETDGWNNNDPVKLDMSDGTVDPINTDPDLGPQYKPEYPKDSGNSPSGEPSGNWGKTGG
jgi:hypothetical protein